MTQYICDGCGKVIKTNDENRNRDVSLPNGKSVKLSFRLGSEQEFVHSSLHETHLCLACVGNAFLSLASEPAISKVVAEEEKMPVA